ncbi:hypothetical protein DFA_03794 [Cavenderia fasciculata]|uniref:Uncharacterized protein n=1 Tax=Cavenderia fasciculata TaxID=261658 RepID=F4Q0E9_CACFS|nr:uncharacterized protein DFA_03794 [Cavenderia fasciculata]EGG18300.1 hypothetical protein DFA_03794 [Cavenderia fasciculata]|eukprot:XP_004357123.1 hypothetical protein DFA_03794 [Cavenderia fasciculata]
MNEWIDGKYNIDICRGGDDDDGLLATVSCHAMIKMTTTRSYVHNRLIGNLN